MAEAAMRHETSSQNYHCDQQHSEYLLRRRPENDKSAFLAIAGYTAEDPFVLMADIREQLLPMDAELLEETEFGPKYSIKGNLVGPNGNSLSVVTIWMTEKASGETEFVTLYPGKK